ncbi:hypothetical protein R5R35_001847 [Gryllus longicercus]|uniref:Mitochondrial cardiolipin hydrolase n=1 Tax=Gryllus longicercus TaxID=2509291 RepID=A0AAN9VEV1_9ORTH
MLGNILHWFEAQPFSKVAGIITALQVIIYASYYFAVSKVKPKVINEVMFFTDQGAGCQEHNENKGRCYNEGCAYSNIRRICEYIESSRSTLDVCIYLITCHDLANSILRVHRRGVSVRVIADCDMAEGSGSQVAVFRRFGIPVRMKKSPYLMHHKFFVVDHWILLTGSFNWTMQAITGNWDNVIVTSRRDIVEPFDNHFAALWDEFTATG